MSLSTTLPPIIYPEEPKEYISTTTLNLKPYKRCNSLHCSELLGNLTFEWHTNVNTPPNTPTAPIVEKPLYQTTSQSSQQQNYERPRDLFLPAFTFEEEDNLPTKVDKFMACERYHSQYQQAMTNRNTNL